MSFSLSIPPVPAERFNATVDETPIQGPEDQTTSDLAALAKQTLKQVAAGVEYPVLAGNASGHAPTGAPEMSGIPSLAVSVYGVNQPVPTSAEDR